MKGKRAKFGALVGLGLSLGLMLQTQGSAAPWVGPVPQGGSWSINNVTVVEGNTATFTITLTDPEFVCGFVDWTTANGTAVEPGDYTKSSGTVGTVCLQLTAEDAPNVSASFTVSVPTVNDTLDENDETFVVNLSQPTDGTTFTNTQGQGTIQDNDPPPAISISDTSVTEGGTANFTVSLSNGSSSNVTVNYTTTSCGSNQASAGSDYNSVPSTTLTFSPGQTSQPVNVTTIQDQTDEPNETFCVTLSNPSSNATIGTGTGQATIVDDDAPPTISINNSPNVTEGGTATFTVSLSNPSSSNVTVNYTTTSCGTNQATAGSDYTSVPSTQLTFTPGQTSQPVNVTTIQDQTDEPNETFCVSLSNPSSNATIGAGTGQALIIDDDGAPQLSIDDVTVNEGAGNATFTVTLSGSTSSTVTVSAQTANGTATAGSDYTAVGPVALSFAPGEKSKTVNVLITNDTLDEPNETFFVNLSGASGATIAANQGLGTIVDNDEPPTQPTLTINDVSVNEGAGNATFTVTVSGSRTGNVTVSAQTSDGTATAGSDYTAVAATTLTFTPNDASKPFTVPITSDSTDEPDETFFVNLSQPSNATISDNQGQGTILDDDAPTQQTLPTVSVNDVSVAEGNAGTTNAVFTVTAGSHASAISVAYATADRTAVAPGDYTASSGRLTIAGGVSSGTISVPVAGDAVVEPDEQFVLDLSSASGATIADGQGVGTIRNDDEAVSVVEPPRAQIESLPPPRETLAVNVTGNGRISSPVVRVTSGRGGAAVTQQISCGLAGSDRILSACHATFRPDQQVQLSATPAAGYRFDGWSGGCAGKARQCSVRLGDSRTVSARFEPLAGAVAVAASLRQPRFRIIWARSIGNGNLLVGGSVSAPARARVQLRRPGGGPLVTKRLSLPGGVFRTTIGLRSGQLRGGALLLPGGFVVSLTGSAQGVRLPLQLKTITLGSPAEGVVREAFPSATQGGAKLLRLPAGTTQAWANFRFATQPRPNLPIEVEWFWPDGRSLGIRPMANRPTINTGIGSPTAIPNGLWRVELRVGGRAIRQLAVRVGPG